MLSLLSVAIGVARGARAVRRLLARESLGTGPSDSVIVAGHEVMFAAAGLSRPRVVVSAGALLELDDEELAAGLDHERGHIARRHRFLLVFAELCRSIGRAVPGSRYALRSSPSTWSATPIAGRCDRATIPTRWPAICKAAGTSETTWARASLGGGRASARLGELIDADADQSARGRGCSTRPR